MSTLCRRIPVTLAPDIDDILTRIAKKNKISLSKSINLFLRQGLEMAEDEYFGVLADSLEDKTTHYTTHDEFWGKALSK